MFYCLMFSGNCLTDSMRTYLLKSSKVMILDKERRLRVKTGEIEGVVWTDFEVVGMGDVYGIRFKAEVDTIMGSTKVEYIVRRKDLEYVDFDYGHWVRFCQPELEPRSSPVNAHLN